ncbi:MAG: fructosamine kinase family protein [Solirubrobacterales bacterium]|nr:fructosamine kinase family protein [Solirubrobacterales bacterium]
MGEKSRPKTGVSHGLFEAAARVVGRQLEDVVNCAGGDINQAWKLRLDDGTEAFLKSRPGAPAREFKVEAAGLEWLAAVGELPVPEVLGVVPGEQPGLLLEWIEPGGRLDSNGEAALGRGLARLHRQEAAAYGQLPDGAPEGGLMVGPVNLGDFVDQDTQNGFGPCYARRLEGLARQAIDCGVVESDQVARIEKLCGRINEFAGPPEPPARTHGDLWSGNILVGTDGRPWLIDPAAHGAHRELDLAMLALFGAPSDRFMGAYREEFPLAPDHNERVELWQIQPLLIHAILFGGSYGAEAARAAGRYV